MADAVIDLADPNWTVRACETLRRQRYAIVRLTPAEAQLTQGLYAAAGVFFDDESRWTLEIPSSQDRAYDSRSGYIPSRNRELFELHSLCESSKRASPSGSATPATPSASPAEEMLRFSHAFDGMCRARCDEALRQLAGGSDDDQAARRSSQVASLLAEETSARTTSSGAGFTNSMLRVYRYTNRYYFDDGDAHHDMGVLTLIPRGTRPGLEIQPDESDRASWTRIEAHMAPDEAILFGGLTLARLTGISALRHRIFTDQQVRYSAPYFLRASPCAWLDAAPGHDAETVADYSARIRQANDDEVHADGRIRLRRSSSDDGRGRDRSPSRRRDQGGHSRRDDGRRDARSSSWRRDDPRRDDRRRDDRRRDDRRRDSFRRDSRDSDQSRSRSRDSGASRARSSTGSWRRDEREWARSRSARQERGYDADPRGRSPADRGSHGKDEGGSSERWQ